MEMTGRYLRLRSDEEAAEKARSWIDALAPELPSGMRDDLRLLTHELVTNAVRHTESDNVWVAAVVTPDAIRVEVSDEGGVTEPAVLPQQDFATSGNGLRWVDRLSDEWGHERHEASSVWFQIELPDAHRPRDLELG